MRQRRQAGVGGATAANDVIWLGVVFGYARTALGVPVDRHVVDGAAETCRRERLIARPAQRTRRPSAEELRALAELFACYERRHGRLWLSMYLLMW